jgi:hypothetical protein
LQEPLHKSPNIVTSMPDYTFASLSPHEFEHLSRDILQRELNVVFESFTPGRDGGRDARWISQDGGTTIVQCKHYARTGYAGLLSALKKEAQRIGGLAPQRYLITTSVGLTPDNKDEIFELFTPFCQSPGDIFGQSDLNNRLGLYPEIEQRHFKLWLTSEAVLTRVLRASIFQTSASTLERARRKVERYVQNASFSRALALLENRRVCVVAGIPGIGKTTLAEIILAHYVDRHNYTAFTIVSDLHEIDSVRRHGAHQIFYYDDFLGKTGLAQLGKNEDRRLVDFMQEVSETPSWRFILTTREYILSQAKERHESLAYAPLDSATCVIRLQDYTAPIRAQILYNHLYFSNLPQELRESVLSDKQYRRIYQHRNYNPRIVEAMTSTNVLPSQTPDTYVAEFLANLDNPQRIWSHAFDNQLANEARNLILVFGTLARTVLVEDLEKAFWSLHKYRQEAFGYVVTENDFSHALKAVDGSFLQTDHEYGELVVNYHNPSIQDFLESRLSERPDHVRDLAASAVFFEQVRSLWEGRGMHEHHLVAKSDDLDFASLFPMTSIRSRSPYPGVEKYSRTFVDALRRTIEAKPCQIIRAIVNDREMWYKGAPRLEARVLFVLDVAERTPSPDNLELLHDLLANISAHLVNCEYHEKDTLNRLLVRCKATTLLNGDIRAELFGNAKTLFTRELDQLDDFVGVADFSEAFKDALSNEDKLAVQKRFNAFLPLEISRAHRGAEPTKVAYLEQTIAGLNRVGEVFRVNLTTELEELNELVAELTPPDPDDDDRRYGTEVADEEMSAQAVDRNSAWSAARRRRLTGTFVPSRKTASVRPFAVTRISRMRSSRTSAPR